ncbi:hypothetical protein B0H16DRAFT_1789766 [Mycena metata]|uniref:DUF5648 domain-containing protein n=1 Tax=Mycena metata TaxID=1033252 RepID=A0AAD7HJT3_9AGAR|nr:hypothetical protein B0H16DRAFT_1789766 [Mycena metata]
MKSYSFNLAFATSALLLALSPSCSASSLAQNASVNPRSPLTCGNPDDSVFYYVMTSSSMPDNFYTALLPEVTNAVDNDGYAFGGVAARVFLTPELSTVPFYRAVNLPDADHLYTTSAAEVDIAVEGGYISEGISAYIYPSQICGSVPFYRIYNSAATEHFYTINETQRDSRLGSGGWADEGIAGYVLDIGPCAE